MVWPFMGWGGLLLGARSRNVNRVLFLTLTSRPQILVVNVLEEAWALFLKKAGQNPV